MSLTPMSKEYAYGKKQTHHRVWVVTAWETLLPFSVTSVEEKDRCIAHLRSLGCKRILVRCIVFKFNKE